MKKALLVLLLLAVAGGLFAQVTFSGDVATGIMVAVEDDTTFHVYNPSPGQAWQFTVSGTVAKESDTGKAGAGFRLIRNNGNAAVPNFDAANVWVEPIVDVLRIAAGNGGPGGFGTPGTNGTSNDAAAGQGLHFRVIPATGFSLGASIQPTGAAIGDSNFRFGVNYNVDLFQVVANLGYTGATDVINAAAGFSFKGLASAGISSIAIDVRADNITNLDTAGSVTVGPIVNFALAGISGNVAGLVYIPVQSGQELDLKARVYGSYPVVPGLATVSLGVGFNLKQALGASAESGTFDYRYWDGIGSGIGTEKTSTLGIQPNVNFSIGGGTLGLGYGIVTQLGDTAKTKHALYTNFSIGF